MICNCILAGTKSCEYCNNRYQMNDNYPYSNEYKFGKTFHIDIPIIEDDSYMNSFHSLNEVENN